MQEHLSMSSVSNQYIRNLQVTRKRVVSGMSTKNVKKM